MKRQNLQPKLAAPVDRSAMGICAKTDTLDRGIDPSKYHVKWTGNGWEWVWYPD